MTSRTIADGVCRAGVGISPLAGLCALLWTMAEAPQAQTASYTHTVIMEASGTVYEPSINDAGQVAFVSAAALHRWDDTGLTVLIPQPGPNSGDRFPSGPVSINASGAVAVLVSSVLQSPAIVVASAPGAVTTVASGAGQWMPNGGVSINDAGDVVFNARNLAVDPIDSYYFMTGNFVPVAGPGDAVPGGVILGAGGGAIDNSGRVAYTAALRDGTTVNAYRTTLPPSNGATLVGPSLSFGVRSFGMNDVGQIAYLQIPGAGYPSIVVTDGVTTSTVFTAGVGISLEPYRIALNNHGQVAFMVTDDVGMRVLVSNGVSLTEVLRTGDTIPGLGVVFDAYLYNEGLNDSGQVALLVRVDGGNRVAVVRAEPPAGNTPPVAATVSASTNEDTTVTGTLAATDGNGDPLTYAIVANGTLGTAVITDASSGAFSYTPNLDAHGADTFSFRANDSTADSNVATVAVTIAPVNDRPVVTGTTISLVEDTEASGQVTASDVDGPNLAFYLQTFPGRGLVNLDAATGAFVYTPHPNASGADTFWVVAFDGQAWSEPAAVTLTIEEVSSVTETTIEAVAPSPSTFGGTVSAVARVTSPAGTPVGWVEFWNGPDIIGSANLVAGVATWTTMRMPPGTLSLVARFAGQPDFGPSESPAVVHVNRQDGRFLPQPPASTVWVPWTLTSGDFNADGVPDVVTGGQGTSPLYVHLGAADGTPGAATGYSAGAGDRVVSALTTGDFNADGRLDLAATSYIAFGSGLPPWAVGVLLGNGDGTFQPATLTATSTVPRSVSAADLNADGRLDLVVAHHVTAAAYVGVLFGNGDGTMQPPVDYAGGDGVAAVGDVDGDGRPDVAYTEFNGDSVRLLVNQGDGTFAPGATSPVSRNPLALVIGDVNRDAVADLVVLSGSDSGAYDLVNVLLGIGGSTFAPSVAYPVAAATSMALADIDENGEVDLIVAGRNAGVVSLLLGIGDGMFDAPKAYAGGAGPTGIAVADFNRDGAADVVASDNDSDSVTVFLNAGGTSVTLTAMPLSLQVGQALTLTAAVSPAVGNSTPMGQVLFLDAGALIGLVGVVDGAAVLTTSSLAPGVHSIVARYGGDTDLNSKNSAPVSITVIAAPLGVTLLAPNGGERVFANVPYTVRWTSTGAPASFDVELSRNGGTTFTPISGCTSVPGTAASCVWTPTAPAGTTLRLRVTARDAGGSAGDVSDANFSVSTATPTLSVTAPNTAVSWRIGTVQSLRWSHNLGVGSLVRVDLSRDGGGSWEVLAGSFANTAATSSTLPWTVTGPATTSALLRVTWLDGPGVGDVSNVPFAVVRPTITVTAPNTAVTWSIGSLRAITWTHNLPAGETVDVDLSRDGGATWAAAATGVANATATTGTFNWTVSGPDAVAARVRVRWSADALTVDVSNVDFAIVAPVVTVTTPSTAVTWRVGSSQTLRATHNLGAGQLVAFDLSVDDGTTWSELARVTSGTSSSVTYPWIVPLPISNAARIRARWVTTPAVADVSDAAFRIIPRTTVTAPNTAATWGAGTTRTVSWTHNLGTSEPVDIAFSADDGATWTVLATAVANTAATTGTTSVRLPNVATALGRMRVSQTSDPAHVDISDELVTLAPAVITVSAPNTNVAWTVGQVRNITWTHNLGTAESVSVELSRDGGMTWEVLSSGLPNSGNTSGTFAWMVSGLVTTTARVRVTWLQNGALQDMSNVTFRIQ